MAIEGAKMLVQEHTQTARDFLEAADREFAAGDVLQGSEKMWGAASHAVMAVAQQQGWPYGSHRALKMAVRRMSEEYGDSALQSEFAAAEKFHANFYHGFMEDFELDEDRPLVRRFVVRVLGLLG
jgi:hypothetical protein